MSSTVAFDLLDRTHDNFATAPVDKAFNWPAFAERTDLENCYMVAFRSSRKPEADVALLEELDEIAHQDAATQPGFLFYFKGKILPGTNHLQNLSFCLWNSKEEARAAAGRSHHRNASAVALKMYDSYKLEKYHAKVHRQGGRVWMEFEPVTD